MCVLFLYYYCDDCLGLHAASNQISKSPPEKPLVAIRPAGSSAPIKMEDVKTERVMLSGDGSVESPVEQPFIQRKQKYVQ